MQRLQALDSAGSALLDLKGRSSAVASCQRRLLFIATNKLEEEGLRLLPEYFSNMGLEFLVCLHQYVFRLCLTLATQVRFGIESVFSAFPNALLEPVSPLSTAESRACRSTRLFEKPSLAA